MDSLKDRYVTYLKGCDLAKNTNDTYVSHVFSFVDYMFGYVSDVGDFKQFSKYFSRYLEKKRKEGLSSSYLRINISAFKKLVDMMGWDSRQVKFRIPRNTVRGVYSLTQDEVSSMLDSKGQGFRGVRDVAILAIFSYLGLRLNELTLLELKDVDMGGKQISIRHAKGNRERVVPIIEIIFPYLERWIKISEGKRDCSAFWVKENGEKLSRRGIQSVSSAAIKSINPRGSTHSLRHTAATMLINKDVELKTICTLLGHSSIKTTADIYTHETSETVGRKLNRIYKEKEKV